jgi:hypothetical protein
MDLFEAAEKLAIIKIAGETYLGVLEGNKVTWAMDFKEYKISHWFQSANTAELTEIEMVNQGHSLRQLSKVEKLEVDRCTALMRRVKTYSMRYYENDLFIHLYKPVRE